jgi:hypothetical protein
VFTHGPWPNADKARTLAFLIRKIRNVMRAEMTVADSVEIADYVETFNALSIPRGYVYVDPDGLVHVVVVRQGLVKKQVQHPFGTEIGFSADVIWDFDPVTGLWNTFKDRMGTFESLCPIKCGGIPTVKLTAGTK